MNRDDFSSATKNLLAKRAGYRCSNPSCRRGTSGPHTDSGRFINVGCAAHITAASEGGPRFDSQIKAEVRSSEENGIWLCATCAKLIDSDVLKFTVEVIREWKCIAEEMAILELETTVAYNRLAPSHLPLPNVIGMTYHEARRSIIACGWQAKNTWWTHHHPNLDIRCGNGLEFFKVGYREIKSALPTGYAFCRFEFTDPYRNTLVVITAGEEIPEQSARAGVVNLFVEMAA